MISMQHFGKIHIYLQLNDTRRTPIRAKNHIIFLICTTNFPDKIDIKRKKKVKTYLKETFISV